MNVWKGIEKDSRKEFATPKEVAEFAKGQPPLSGEGIMGLTLGVDPVPIIFVMSAERKEDGVRVVPGARVGVATHEANGGKTLAIQVGRLMIGMEAETARELLRVLRDEVFVNGDEEV